MGSLKLNEGNDKKNEEKMANESVKNLYTLEKELNGQLRT